MLIGLIQSGSSLESGLEVNHPRVGLGVGGGEIPEKTLPIKGTSVLDGNNLQISSIGLGVEDKKKKMYEIKSRGIGGGKPISTEYDRSHFIFPII